MTRKYSLILFALLCVAFFAQTVCFAQEALSLVNSAYDRIKDQVNDKTFLVVRVDLTAIDTATFTVTADSVYTDFLKERGFNNAKIKSARHEFHGALNTVGAILKKFETMRAALGVREIFLVVQNESDNSVRFVVPGAQGGLSEQIQALGGVSAPVNAVKTSNGYAFSTNADEDAKIYQKFKAGDNSRLKRFFQSEASGEIQIFCSVFDLEKIYRTVLNRIAKEEASDKLLEEAKPGIEAFSSYFQQVKISINVAKLTIKGSLEFTTAEHAEDAYNGLVTLINALVDNTYKNKSSVLVFSQSTSEKYNLIALDREIQRASLKAALPKRVANSLNFEFTPDSKNFWSNTCVIPLF